MNLNSEPCLAEATASTLYVSLGFIGIPLLFIFIGFDKRMGSTIKEVFAASCNMVFHNPITIGLIIILEIIACISFLRMYRQKLVLTPTTLIAYTGYLKQERTDIPLQDIKAININISTDRIERKLRTATILIETQNGEKMEFPLMKNAHKFVDDVEFQIYKVKNSKQ